jgi:hypothetical protein
MANIEINSAYSVLCAGDAVVGDEITFRRAVMIYKKGNYTFDRYDLITAKIIKETPKCYSLEMTNGETIQIMQKIMYKEQLFRKPWDDETAREELADEKRIKNAKLSQIDDKTIDMFGF